MKKTPYQEALWSGTRVAARNAHRFDATTMVTMIGEIDVDRYGSLPSLHGQLQVLYQETLGEPPLNRIADLARIDGPKKAGGKASRHPTTTRRPGEKE